MRYQFSVMFFRQYRTFAEGGQKLVLIRLDVKMLLIGLVLLKRVVSEASSTMKRRKKNETNLHSPGGLDIIPINNHTPQTMSTRVTPGTLFLPWIVVILFILV